MKKVMFQFSALLVFCFLAMSSSPPLPDQTNNVMGPGTDQQTVLDIDGNYTKTFNILVTNLDFLHAVACEADQELPLPPGYPTLHMRFQIYDEIDTGSR